LEIYEETHARLRGVLAFEVFGGAMGSKPLCWFAH